MKESFVWAAMLNDMTNMTELYPFLESKKVVSGIEGDFVVMWRHKWWDEGVGDRPNNQHLSMSADEL